MSYHTLHNITYTTKYNSNNNRIIILLLEFNNCYTYALTNLYIEAIIENVIEIHEKNNRLLKLKILEIYIKIQYRIYSL
jgi:hypothetical protein